MFTPPIGNKVDDSHVGHTIRFVLFKMEIVDEFRLPTDNFADRWIVLRLPPINVFLILDIDGCLLADSLLSGEAADTDRGPTVSFLSLDESIQNINWHQNINGGHSGVSIH